MLAAKSNNIDITRTSASCRTGKLQHRSAFTVMELLIVMGVVVLIASMAAPQLMVSIRESAVFSAADEVREAAGEARRFAIDSGIDYEFRFEINGASAVVLPSETELNVDEDANTSNSTEKYQRLLVELPKNFRLRAEDGIDEPGETIDSARFGDLAGRDGSPSQKLWSSPVFFRFDGTAQDYVMQVSDDQGLTSNLSIRGLTGSIRISQVHQGDL